MHEQSLVRSLLTQVEQLRQKHKAVSVDVVTVELGPLSGVEPALIETAFELLAPQQFSTVPDLEIHLIDLSFLCQECGLESTVPQIEFQCPHCDSCRVQILQGDQFRLIDVSLQIPEPSSEVVR